jgi:hypothetical protein
MAERQSGLGNILIRFERTKSNHPYKLNYSELITQLNLLNKVESFRLTGRLWLLSIITELNEWHPTV